MEARLAAGLGRVVARALLLSACMATPVAAFTATLITDGSLVNRTPGDDLRIGTGDDATIAGGVGPNQSGPNTHGAASFALLDPGGQPPDASSFTYLVFVDGTLQVTANYPGSTADHLALTITGGSLRSTTELDYPTRGEATTTIDNGVAQLNPLTGAGQVKLTGRFVPGTAPAFSLSNETLAAAPGQALIVLPASLGRSGNAYADSVLTPMAPAGATAIVVVEFTGTVVSPGCCTGWATRGVLAAYTTDDLGCADVFPDLCPGVGGGGACTSIPTCRTALASVLPTRAGAADKRARRTAAKLTRIAGRTNASLDRAAAAAGTKQQKLYGRARTLLQKLVAAATTAGSRGTLGVPLAPLQAAINALLVVIPS